MKRVFAAILGILFLLGTNGVTVAQHYCGGKVHSSAIQLTPESLGCGMPTEINSCQEGSAVRQTPCCKDVFQQYRVTEDFQSYESEVQIPFLISVLHVFKKLDLTPYRSELEACFTVDPPPLITADIPVFIQSFLI